MTDTVEDIMDNEEDVVQYAGFKVRLWAVMIDTLLIFAVFYVLFPGAMEIEGVPPEMNLVLKDAAEQKITLGEAYTEIARLYAEGGHLSRMLFDSLLQILVAGLIIIPFWIYRSATPGKMLFGLKIVDVESLKEPSRRQIFIRFLGYITLICFIWILFNEKKQGLHDKMASTTVIYARYTDPEIVKKRKFIIHSIIAIILLVSYFMFLR